MLKLRKFFSEFDRSTIGWAGFLLLCLLGQFAIQAHYGEKGRDAISNRLERTEAKFQEEATVFETPELQTKALWKSIQLREYVSSGLWYGAAFGIGVISLLLITIFWWGKPLKAKLERVQLPDRRTWIVLAIITVIGAGVRIPRMDLSLYNDESFNFTRYIHGQFKHDKETGEATFKKQSWQQTLFGNHFANNGVLYSSLARLFHDQWQKSTDAVDGQVNEVALRMPSLISGSLSILGIGILGFLAFGTRGAVLASVMTALHPWHLRYSTEARSYGMVMLFATLILISLILAIREGRWRWWILFGASQFLCLWSYIGSTYFLLAANAIAFAWLLKSNRAAIPRWIVANLIGAVFFVQLMAPSLPQIHLALESASTLQGYTDLLSILEILAYLVSGMPFHNLAPESPYAPAWQKIGVIGTLLFCVLIAIVLAGVIQLFRKKNGNGIFIAMVGISAVIIAILLSNLSEGILHHWYVIYSLPAFIFLLATSAETLWKSRVRSLGLVALLGIIISFASPFSAYNQHSKEQLKPLMLHVRGEVYPFESEEARKPLLAAFWSDIVYDPTIIYTPSIATLEKAIARSKIEKRPLFVEFGYRPRALMHNADLVKFIEESGKFEFLKTFHGFEQTQFTHHLFRLKETAEE